LNFFPSQEIKLVKSSYVYDLSKFEAKTDRVDNIVFFTSGNFKYRSRKKWCDIELDFISQVNRFCIDNGIRLLIKPKDGEQVHIAEKLNFLGINSIQFYKILSESSFNPVDLPPRTCVISSIDSSVFLESLICGLPTFYYEFPDNIKKDIYLSFLPLNRIDIHSLQSYIEYSVFKINSQFLNQLRQITLEKLESDSNQSLSSLITKL
jgi:hypothetical protein